MVKNLGIPKLSNIVSRDVQMSYCDCDCDCSH